MEDVFLTSEEVLEYLQVNLRTVYRLIKAGKIPAVRVGRQWRFRKADIDRWLSTQGNTPAVAETKPGGHAAPVHTRTTAGRPRVLVVDDEASIRDLLRRALTMAEYDVEDAPDGRKALELMQASKFDLLITDLKMPGMDGLALIHDVKRLTPTLPIIIITGFSTEANAIEALNLGAHGYLTKPFRIDKILMTAAAALGE